MCRRITCNTCGKPSWAGCGAHVEQVLGDVPAEDRCACASGPVPASTPRWLRRLLPGNQSS